MTRHGAKSERPEGVGGAVGGMGITITDDKQYAKNQRGRPRPVMAYFSPLVTGIGCAARREWRA